MDSQSERQLLARLRRGDASAFDAIHAAYHIRLFNFLARLARNRQVAEDLLEETWLRLVRHAGKLRDDTQLGPWLYTVARNLHTSYCRSRAFEDAHASLGVWPQPLARSPFEQAAASELEQRVEAALARVPAMYREVLLLVGIEGLTPSEAATVCGVSAETLRQRLKRARQMLASELDEGAAAKATVPREVNS